MRSIRFREALAAYLCGLVVAHLRLLSMWSGTAGRLHFWLTQERGEVPTPLATYRTDETALKIYADSLAEENDRLRWAVRLGLWGLIGAVLGEIGSRLTRLLQVVWDLTRGFAITVGVIALSLAGAVLVGWGVDLLFRDLPAYLATQRAADRPDAGQPDPYDLRWHRFEICVADRPRYVLRVTAWERAPRLLQIGEVRAYWWGDAGAPPWEARTEIITDVRDCGAELYPRPGSIVWTEEMVLEPVVVVLD